MSNEFNYKQRRNTPEYRKGWDKVFGKKVYSTNGEDIEDIICPICGYYCLGNGGHGCIDKKAMFENQNYPSLKD